MACEYVPIAAGASFEWMAVFMVRVEFSREDAGILAQVNAALIASLEKLLGTPRDGALLRFSLGSEFLKGGDAARAAGFLREAVEKDPGYSAAWKLLGRALVENGRAKEALEAYRKGIEAAHKKGDKQAGKEMAVFARRIEKALAKEG
jgi:predicted Zn-dependent protease